MATEMSAWRWQTFTIRRSWYPKTEVKASYTLISNRENIRSRFLFNDILIHDIQGRKKSSVARKVIITHK
jgi:hypothetical protein